MTDDEIVALFALCDQNDDGRVTMMEYADAAACARSNVPPFLQEHRTAVVGRGVALVGPLLRRTRQVPEGYQGVSSPAEGHGASGRQVGRS